MSRLSSRVITLFFAAFVLPAFCLADPLSKDDQAFFDKHISEFVQIQPQKLSDPALVKIFSITFFQVTITLNEDGGTSSQQITLAKFGDKMIDVSRPGTDMDLPDFPKMLNPNFKLKSDDDAKVLQNALNVAYPAVTDDDKKAIAFKHSGNQWTFVRGTFIAPKVLGFIFQTDDTGKITSAKFSLQIQ